MAAHFVKPGDVLVYRPKEQRGRDGYIRNLPIVTVVGYDEASHVMRFDSIGWETLRALDAEKHNAAWDLVAADRRERPVLEYPETIAKKAEAA